MPDEEVRPSTAAFIREHLGRMERGDIAEGISDYAEDAVLEAALVGEADSVLNGTCHGRVEIGRWIDSWFSSFERGSYRFEVEESIETGEGPSSRFTTPLGARRAAWRRRCARTTPSSCATDPS